MTSKLYLAGIRDLHDHSLVGWSMGERQTTDLVIAALVMALGRRQPGRDLVHDAIVSVLDTIDHLRVHRAAGNSRRLSR